MPLIIFPFQFMQGLLHQNVLIGFCIIKKYLVQGMKYIKELSDTLAKLIAYGAMPVSSLSD